MGSQQRNVNLATKLPIKSKGGYYMSNNTKTEFNPYEKYKNGPAKPKNAIKKKKGRKK